MLQFFKNIKLLILICIITTIISCHHDSEDISLVNTSIPGPKVINSFFGNLQVFVTNIQGNPIENAEVHIYGNKLLTNKYGIADFKNIELDNNGTFVRAIKDSYLFGSDKFFPSGTNNYTVIRMLPIENLKVFDSNNSVSIEIENGGLIDFTSGSLIDNQGQTYLGQTKMSSYGINSTEINFDKIIPGSLFGIAKNGNSKIIEMYSCVSIHLTKPSSEILSLKSGKTAKISFPILSSDLTNLPANLPMWYFDEMLGNWVEEGTAKLVNNHYEAEVSHFSFWACGNAYELIDFSIEIESSNGLPAEFLQVDFKLNTYVYKGLTDAKGKVSGKLPRSEDLTITLSTSNCNVPLYESSVLTGENGLILDKIILDKDITLISGKILCMGTETNAGSILVKSLNHHYIFKPDIEGNFQISLSETTCDTNSDIILLGFNIDKNNESEEILINVNSPSNVEIEICSDCNFNADLFKSFSTSCDEMITIKTEIVTQNASSYSFLWSTNETTEEIIVESSGTYCVTITDTKTDCSIEKCIDILINQGLNLSFVKQDINCFENGFIMVNVTGGQDPYVFKWEGPAGFVSDTELIDNLMEPGVYKVTVTDINNCTAVSSKEIENKTKLYNLFITSSVNSNVICGDEDNILNASCLACPEEPSQYLWKLPDGQIKSGKTISASMQGVYELFAEEPDCFLGGSLLMQKTEFFQPEINFECLDEVYIADISGYNPMHTIAISTPNKKQMIENFDNFLNDNFVVLSEYNNCEEIYPFTRPYSEGFKIIDVINPTCDTCEDGYILYDVNNTTEYNTNFGKIAIYKKNKYNIDLVTNNIQQNLGKGEYYAVTLSDTGCVINSVKFEL